MGEKKIIAISGKKRTGKNTVANLFKKYLPNSVCVGFGDAVKYACAEIMGLDREEFFNDENKDKIYQFYDGVYMSGRDILQKMATEALRDNFNKSVWITNMNNRISISDADYIIIYDLRFENEYDFLDKQGSLLLRVERMDIENNDFHISENEIDDKEFKYILRSEKNDFKHLEKLVKSIIDNEFGR